MTGRRHTVRDRINRGLDRLPRPTLGIGGLRVRSYAVCVIGGVIAGAATAVTLAWRSGLSLAAISALAALAVLVALALAVATRWIRGFETFTFYHYQIATLLACASSLAALGSDIGAYLDVLAVGLATTQAFGRLGCLLAGCCHGRPATLGIRYDHRHVALGLPRYRVGARLLPVQLIESAALFALAAGGIAALAAALPAGTVVAGYLVAYALLRIALETLRGDERPVWGPLSEGQWTAAATLLAVAALQASGGLPTSRPILIAAAAGIGLATVIAASQVRRHAGGFRRPVLVRAVQALLDRVEPDGGILAATVDPDVEVSASEVALDDGATHVVTFAHPDPSRLRQLSPELARAVRRCAHPGATIEAIAGRSGRIHFVLRTGEPAHAV